MDFNKQSVAPLGWKSVPLSDLWKHLSGGLAVILTAWLTWFPLAVLYFFADFIFISGAKGGGSDKWIHDLWGVAFWVVILAVIVVVSGTVWLSVEDAVSKERPPIQARIGAVTCALVTALLFAGVGEYGRMMTGRFGEQAMENQIAETHPASRISKPRDPSFPLAAFWKAICDFGEDGIAIEVDSPRQKIYRVESCPDAYGNCLVVDRSRIFDDSNYRIPDPDTIEIYLPGGNAEIVHRCVPKTDSR